MVGQYISVAGSVQGVLGYAHLGRAMLQLKVDRRYVRVAVLDGNVG
jgi:hypothetical protein